MDGESVSARGVQDESGAQRDKPKKTDWVAEIRSVIFLILAVLAFHSLVAKPFYIPSESMMPALQVGDRLVVSKYPYGWSYVSPSFHVLPPIEGRLFGKMPERGDIVIVKPRDSRSDYIKRVIGLPGDRLEVRGGTVILNGVPVKQQRGGHMRLSVDPNSACNPVDFPDMLRTASNGSEYCDLPIVRETLPNGRSYDTIDIQPNGANDYYGPVTIPEGSVFLMGDNRDNSADSRVPLTEGGLGGPVPWETLGGRAEFITFSLDGSETWNPLTWPGAFRPGRAGRSLHPTQAHLAH